MNLFVQELIDIIETACNKVFRGMVEDAQRTCCQSSARGEKR